MYRSLEKTEKLWRAAALTIPGVGSATLRYLVALYGSVEAAGRSKARLKSGDGRREGGLEAFFAGRDSMDIAQMEQRLARYEISLTVPGEDTYPSLLGDLPDAPPLLFYRGTLEAQRRAVAFVGARQATVYGKSAARALSEALSRQGYVVVSGLARGIDGAAHEGALAAGTTWAFLAGGLDTIYPPEHQDLAEKIVRQGALVSEYPPGLPSLPQNFPARNRLISGVSLGVVVVEAAKRSGALITADFALEQGREVFAVPGPIFSPVSRGCHALLRSGARLVETAADILEEIEHPAWPKLGTEHQATLWPPESLGQLAVGLPDAQEESREAGLDGEVLSCLSDSPLHVDRLALQCALAPQALALALFDLELRGRIRRLPGHYYVLEREPALGRKNSRGKNYGKNIGHCRVPG